MKIKYFDQLRKSSKSSVSSLSRSHSPLDNWACSSHIKNINHKQLATNTGYAAIHYSNPVVSIAYSLVQQNQLAAPNNFMTSFAWVSEWRPRE